MVSYSSYDVEMFNANCREDNKGELVGKISAEVGKETI